MNRLWLAVNVTLRFSGGSVIFAYPNGAGEMYMDISGDWQVGTGNDFLLDIESNAAKVFCTAAQFFVEMFFLRDYHWCINGSRYELFSVPQQYLFECGYAPTPQ
ncbi:uncharacterized protein LOC111715694, partial [Eurytemora carolleeae]|uniref:uncharacterized protein LOC111715694 n=1 Tax=Eurytemora carolleeae TaxID=1294199 RepID=UPI000C76832E